MTIVVEFQAWSTNQKTHRRGCWSSISHKPTGALDLRLDDFPWKFPPNSKGIHYLPDSLRIWYDPKIGLIIISPTFHWFSLFQFFQYPFYMLGWPSACVPRISRWGPPIRRAQCGSSQSLPYRGHLVKNELRSSPGTRPKACSMATGMHPVL